MRSYTLIAASLIVLSANLTLAAPTPHDVNTSASNLSNAYSGASGDASGGSTNTTPSPACPPLGSVLALGSGEWSSMMFGRQCADSNGLGDNAGDGNKANSGDAQAGGPSMGSTNVSKSKAGVLSMGNAAGSKMTAVDSGNAYSGAAGKANGGDATSPPALLKILSGTSVRHRHIIRRRH